MSNIYSAFDYLCDEPYIIPGIGYFRCPTLRDVRRATYKVFLYYMNIISCSLEDYLKIHKVYDDYVLLSEEERQRNTLFYLLLEKEAEIFLSMVSLLVVGRFTVNTDDKSIEIYHESDGKYEKVGEINNDNFEYFREQMRYILGVKSIEESDELKFKNKIAEKLFAKMQKHESEKAKEKSSNGDYELDNMIKKYCTHNKVGINILNVWDMTYCQFLQIFNEYCYGRQCDINDDIAANTFTYKKSEDYKASDYIKKIKTNK